jgi:hypothetical protein
MKFITLFYRCRNYELSSHSTSIFVAVQVAYPEGIQDSHSEKKKISPQMIVRSSLYMY